MKVSVAKFRQSIESLERIVHVDYHATVGDREKFFWIQRAEKAANALLALDCPRATDRDRKAKICVLGHSARLIIGLAEEHEIVATPVVKPATESAYQSKKTVMEKALAEHQQRPEDESLYTAFRASEGAYNVEAVLVHPAPALVQ